MNIENQIEKKETIMLKFNMLSTHLLSHLLWNMDAMRILRMTRFLYGKDEAKVSIARSNMGSTRTSMNDTF